MAVIMLVMVALQAGADAAKVHSALSAFLHASPVTETIRKLDTNGNLKVDRKEIEAFAQTQGLNPQDVMGDFQELDRNDDDELDFAEISQVLSEADAQQGALSTPVASATVAPVAAAAPEVKAKSSVIGALASKASATDSAAAAMEVFTGLSSVSKKTGEDSTDNVQEQAEQQADKILASNFASRAQTLLRQSAADEKAAAMYANQAHTLRGKSQELVRNAKEVTQRAAAQTALQVGQAAEPKIKELQVQAQKLEHEASQQRVWARQAMQKVIKAQSLMSKLFPSA